MNNAARLLPNIDNLSPSTSDLAYLLHDNDEEIYSDSSASPPVASVRVPVKYIVDNLADYGAKCIPLKVFVSGLLRTWETALLLYLPFLYNNKQLDYSQTLILEVSPFLLEKDGVINQSSNNPFDFEGNVKEFFNFIKLFIFFKSEYSDFFTKLYNSLNKIPDKFTIILVAGGDKIYLRIDIAEKKVEYYQPESSTTNPISLDGKYISISLQILNKIEKNIVNEIENHSADKYESYNEDRLDTSKPPPQTIYSTFELHGIGKNFDNFVEIVKYGPDIFSFLKWVIEFKSHPKNTPILFVSHSGTMNQFLKMMISNLNYNYNDTSQNFPPSPKFVDVCKKLRETNTWSMRFKYLGYNVTGFRHAQSCDNMYKMFDKSESKGDTAKKFLSLGGVYVKQRMDRQKYGKYTNLSLWGIFSTLIFSSDNKKNISEFNDNKINESGFMVLSGMVKQPKDSITKFGMNNELTCGDPVSRFLVSSANSSKSKSSLKVIKLEKVVDIISSSGSLELRNENGGVIYRQQMSNKLYSLDNIFKIKFIDCGASGCKIKVNYVGFYSTNTTTGNDTTLNDTAKNKIILTSVAKRVVNININYDAKKTEYELTFQNVYAGGMVFDIDGTQSIKTSIVDKSEEIKYTHPSRNKFTLEHSLDKKKEISSDFQKSVGFLMGFDLIKASTSAEQYNIDYNTLILYSNLLIRQLENTYKLTFTDRSITWNASPQFGLAKKSKGKTIDFFTTGTTELYGGNNDK